MYINIYMYDFEYAVRLFSSSSLSQCAFCLGVHLPYIPFGWMKQYIEILLLLLLMVWAHVVVVVVLCFFHLILFYFVSAFFLFYSAKSLMHTFCAVSTVSLCARDIRLYVPVLFCCDDHVAGRMCLAFSANFVRPFVLFSHF